MKFERILCPVDFSEPSAAALRMAGMVARVLGAELTVLHAQRWEFPAYFTLAQTRKLRAQLRKSEGAARRYFESFAKRNLPDKVSREYRVVDEEPESAILHLAEEKHADLIVMGTHGRTGWSRFHLGSVMEGVLRQAGVPILAVGPHVRAPGASIRRILCPVDFDGLSRVTIGLAAFLAGKTGAHLTALHVVEPKIGKTSGKAGEDRLVEWLACTPKAQCTMQELVRYGNVVEAIVEEAGRIDADLVVIGAQPKPSLGSIMFGSTTESLIRSALCPVLVVRLPKAEREPASAPTGSEKG